MKTTDVNKIWEALGSFWGDFEDRALINELWQGYFLLFSGLYQKSLDLRNSIGFQNMPGVLEDKHQSYEIIYSVTDELYSGLINAYLVSGVEGDRYETDIDPGTISIPTLDYYYYTDSGTIPAIQTLTEGTDYYIVDYERLRFVSDPPFTVNQNQSYFSGQTLFAETVYRVNPSLWGAETKAAGMNENMLIDHDYNAFVSGQAYESVTRDKIDTDHFKYLVWGVQNGLRQQPTISSIRNLYGLVRGLPFAHNSGVYSSGIIGTSSKDYPISGYYSFNMNSGYITIDRPMFLENDYQIDIIAKLNDAPSTDQYLLGISGTWGAGSKWQSMRMFYEADTGDFIYEVKGSKELNPSFNLTGLYYALSSGSFNPFDWNKYSIRKTGAKTFEFYHNDRNVFAEDTIASPNWSSSPADYKFVVGARYAYDGTNEQIIDGNSGLTNVNIAQIKTTLDDDRVCFYSINSPDNIDHLNSVYVKDLGASGYSTTISGVAAWQQVTMPLMGYTHIAADTLVKPFTVLLSGVDVYDHVNNASHISGLLDFEFEDYRHISIQDSGLMYKGVLTHNEEFLNQTLADYMPSHLTYSINDEVYSGLFIAPWGLDTNDGSRKRPMRTFEAAAPLVPPNGTLWFRKGTYNELFKTSYLAHSGTSWDAPLRIKAFPGERVKLVNSINTNSGVICFDRNNTSTRQFVSFEDFEVDGLNQNKPLAKFSWGGVTRGCRLKNCWFYGNNNNSNDIVYGMDVYVRGPDNVVTQCRFGDGTYRHHKAIEIIAANVASYVTPDCDISYNSISGYLTGISAHQYDTYYQYLRRPYIHHNHVSDCKTGVFSSADRTYVYTNLIENCNKGLELGTERRDVNGVYFNNTIRNIKVSGVWGVDTESAGIYLGSGGHVHPSYSTQYSFCESGFFANNVITNCDNVTYYDPSGVVHPNNFWNVHERNLEDSADLPKTGYTSADTNINSGIIFYYKFRTAEQDKDLRLHPFFSSGYKHGADVSSYSAFTDINLDYSGIARSGYSGWDLGAFETIV